MKSRLGSDEKSRRKRPEKQDPENLRKLSEELGRALDEWRRDCVRQVLHLRKHIFIDLVPPQFRAPAFIIGELCALATRLS